MYSRFISNLFRMYSRFISNLFRHFVIFVRCFSFLFFYWLYLDFVFFLFDLLQLIPVDFFLHELSSQPLDFGWTCHFDNNGGDNLPAPRESAASINRLNPYEIYQRIQILEARDYYNLPPQNNPGDYEREVQENLSRMKRNLDLYNKVYEITYFEVRVLELKGILQDRLTSLMLSEPNIDRILELTPYYDVRTEAYNFIEEKYPPIYLSAFGLPPSRFIIEESLHALRSQTTGLNTVDHVFYKSFYSHFTDEEFRRSIGLPLP